MTNAFSPAFKSAIDWSKDQRDRKISEQNSAKRAKRLASDDPVERAKAAGTMGPLSGVTENHRLDEAREVVAAALRDRLADAHLFTTSADLDLLTNRRGEARLHRRKPSYHEAGDARDRAIMAASMRSVFTRTPLLLGMSEGEVD